MRREARDYNFRLRRDIETLAMNAPAFEAAQLVVRHPPLATI